MILRVGDKSGVCSKRTLSHPVHGLRLWPQWVCSLPDQTRRFAIRTQTCILVKEMDKISGERTRQVQLADTANSRCRLCGQHGTLFHRPCTGWEFCREDHTRIELDRTLRTETVSKKASWRTPIVGQMSGGHHAILLLSGIRKKVKQEV